MRLTINEKEINSNLEAEARNCDQRAKEHGNMILNAKVTIEEAEKAMEQWQNKAVGIRGLKFQEHV